MSTPASATPPATNATVPTAPVSLGSFLKWGAAFGIYAIVLIGLDDSDNYASVAQAFAWLVAGSAVVYWHANLGKHLTDLTGIKL